MSKKLRRFIESKRIAYMGSINNSSYQKGVDDICKCIAEEVLRLEKSPKSSKEAGNSTSPNTTNTAICPNCNGEVVPYEEICIKCGITYDPGTCKRR